MAKREGWSHQERERLLEGRSRPHKQTNALRVCVWLIKAPERVLLTTQLRLRDAPSATCSHRTSSVPDTGQPRPPRHHRLFSTRQVDASHLHNPASRNSAWAVSCMQAGWGLWRRRQGGRLLFSRLAVSNSSRPSRTEARQASLSLHCLPESAQIPHLTHWGRP